MFHIPRNNLLKILKKIERENQVLTKDQKELKKTCNRWKNMNQLVIHRSNTYLITNVLFVSNISPTEVGKQDFDYVIIKSMRRYACI
jgi:hypothetical protein